MPRTDVYAMILQLVNSKSELYKENVISGVLIQVSH